MYAEVLRALKVLEKIREHLAEGVKAQQGTEGALRDIVDELKRFNAAVKKQEG